MVRSDCIFVDKFRRKAMSCSTGPIRLSAVLSMIAVAAGLFACGGCYDQNQVKAFLQTPRSPVSGVDYRVYPPDELHLTSLYVSEINDFRTTVRPDGKINVPLLGEIDVAGKTPKQIEDLVRQAALPYYRKVSPMVEVSKYNSQKIFVFGHVLNPGPIPWTGHDTLLDILCRTHPTAAAWPERILVVRGDHPQIGGHPIINPAEENDYARRGLRPENKGMPRHVMVVNLKAMIRYGDYSNDILLMPNDVVYVQPNPLAKVGIFFSQLFSPWNSVTSSTNNVFNTQVNK